MGEVGGEGFVFWHEITILISLLVLFLICLYISSRAYLRYLNIEISSRAINGKPVSCGELRPW